MGVGRVGYGPSRRSVETVLATEVLVEGHGPGPLQLATETSSIVPIHNSSRLDLHFRKGPN
jgi:hypothetical protein